MSPPNIIQEMLHLLRKRKKTYTFWKVLRLQRLFIFFIACAFLITRVRAGRKKYQSLLARGNSRVRFKHCPNDGITQTYMTFVNKTVIYFWKNLLVLQEKMHICMYPPTLSPSVRGDSVPLWWPSVEQVHPVGNGCRSKCWLRLVKGNLSMHNYICHRIRTKTKTNIF